MRSWGLRINCGQNVPCYPSDRDLSKEMNIPLQTTQAYCCQVFRELNRG